MVDVVVRTDAEPVADELDAAGWPKGSAPEKLLQRRYGRCWMTWMTWHPEEVLLLSVVTPKLEIRQRSERGHQQ